MANQSSDTIRVGIDLGTTNTSISVLMQNNDIEDQNYNVETLENSQGNKTTPSVISFTDTNKLIGEVAQ